MQNNRLVNCSAKQLALAESEPVRQRHKIPLITRRFYISEIKPLTGMKCLQ